PDCPRQGLDFDVERIVCAEVSFGYPVLTVGKAGDERHDLLESFGCDDRDLRLDRNLRQIGACDARSVYRRRGLTPVHDLQIADNPSSLAACGQLDDLDAGRGCRYSVVVREEALGFVTEG